MPASSLLTDHAPRQTFGVSFPSTGIRENLCAAASERLTDADDRKAAAPATSRTRLREMDKLMFVTPIDRVSGR